MDEERIVGLFRGIPFEEMTNAEIEECLLEHDVGGRFDGDIEFLNLVRHGGYAHENSEQMRKDAERMRELLRHSGVPIGFRLGED